ncbi:MAG: caspase family protein [Caldilineaceae bacterium]|nr:caspase family protein [Caldilineaceae bacterium]HRJ44558.1 caspase family protein [Caldilineaceae bacterium]
MSKRALLVGINQFQGRPEWLLRGCVNDARAMSELLKQFYGFQSDEIYTAFDSDASGEGIRAGLAWLFSGYDGDGKDVRLFHIASHGTQVTANDEKDEEEDRLDEVIVPFDHDWSRPFTDDQLRETFTAIPEGVNFTFIADCCHSGSIDKDLLPAEFDVRPRRVEPPAAMQARIQALTDARFSAEAQEIEARYSQALTGLTFAERRVKERGLREQIKALLFAERKKKMVGSERHVLLAACEDVQTAADAFIEGSYRGAFTWSLGKAITESNGNITYGDLHGLSAKALKAGGYSQNPQLACNDARRGLRFLNSLA